MVPRKLTRLLVVTTAFEAFRFGAGTFRALLDLPARHVIGPVAFAAFSRATDLSPTGIAFYVLYGFGGLLLTGATWIGAARVGAPRVVRRLAATAALSSLAILAFTTQAAPLMFRIGKSPDESGVLADLLDRFTVWTNLRIVLADLSFFCVLSALAYLALRAPGGEKVS
jgi:hypothetical protein